MMPPVDALLSPEGSLISLLAASFLAATLLPLSSEAALFAVLKLHADLLWPAIAVATLGNTLGGLSSYLIGRCIAVKNALGPFDANFGANKSLAQVGSMQRWGAPALLFAWLPVVGDALSVAAGWLQLNWIAVACYQAVGRFLRYWVVSVGALW
jgi:membrane protein YqaA with SNARE-associated domain